MQFSKKHNSDLGESSFRNACAARQRKALMRLTFCFLVLLWSLSLSVVNQSLAQDGQQQFTVVVYNVNNLFDGDGVALFDDYQSDKYPPKHLLKKVENIVRVIAQVEPDGGPHIVLFQEIEADQTPEGTTKNYDRLLAPFQEKTLAQMLAEPFSDQVRDLPAEALLLKALSDAGMGPYHVAAGQYRPDPTGRTVAHINVTFSKFPIVSSRTHQTSGARGILEVVHRIADQSLITFNNHWKSEAGNPEAEKVRIGNAQVLRGRLDQLFQEDPLVDVVVAGDFNSLYNQADLYPKMQPTAINGVLRSQGIEIALQQTSGPDLYNLWYELPSNQRGSDVYRGKWGTLMQMIISRGLYDHRGIQYVDNSFSVAAFQNLNAQAGTGVPIRWQMIDDTAGGYSDHLPIAAKFRAVRTSQPPGFITLSEPAVTDLASDKQPIDVDYRVVVPANSVRSTEQLGSDIALKNPDNLGHVFRVKAKVSGEKPFRITIFNDEYLVWSFDKEQRVKLYKTYPVGSTAEFLGELGIHKGKWEFLIHDDSWIKP